MRGRSPFNKPSVREKAVFELLLKLGGEARWKTLKANLKELRWGPTTLKRTLDRMVEEKSVIKEARLGKKGAEVWYRTLTDLDLLRPTIVWKPKVEVKGREEVLVRWIASIREEIQQLDGKEKEIFLRDRLHRMLGGAMQLLVGSFMTSLVTAELHKLNEPEILLNFDYGFDYAVQQPCGLMLQLFLEYREYALEIMDQIFREPYKPPSVAPRSVKGLVESQASALQWIKSYEDITQLRKK